MFDCSIRIIDCSIRVYRSFWSDPDNYLLKVTQTKSDPFDQDNPHHPAQANFFGTTFDLENFLFNNFF